MAIISPFKAYRYNSHKVEIGKCVTQPYDKINKDLQKQYYENSPYNIVRVILGYDTGDDYKGRDNYQMADVYLNDWMKNNILVKDSTPSLYYYTQTFKMETGEEKTRHGFIGLGKIDETKVHAHEHTLSGPKKGRLDLLRATQANYGQIFMLYNDPGNQVEQTISKGVSGQPEVSVQDEDGNTHKLWLVSDPEVILAVQQLMKEKELFIADGHHRYETSVNYRQEMLDQGKHTADMDYLMMTFINMADPGLVILPTHRCVSNLSDFNFDHFLKQATAYFEICELKDAKTLAEAMKTRQSEKVIGLYLPNKYFLLVLNKDADIDKVFDADQSQAYKHLDVSLLHTHLIENILGITKEAQSLQTNLSYVRGFAKAISKVDTGLCQMVFLLNPTAISEVKEIAGAGERMPQKSTDFYPKLLSGMTIYKMGIAG